MSTVVIHQPEYFPWLGFLDKAQRADVLVLLDHVQFDRSSLQHRARISGSNGPFWLTIPYVHAFPQQIDEVRIVDQRWKKKHFKSIVAAYGRAPGFDAMREAVDRFYTSDYDRLVDVGCASVDMLLDAFGVHPGKVVRSSTLELTATKGDLVLEICRQFRASRYIAGRTGATYLDQESFAKADIAIEVQNFSIPSYRGDKELPEDQRGGLSALDAWAFLGRDARHLIDSQRPD